MYRSKCANWHAHVNHLGASRLMRWWLTDPMSLTAKLVARSAHFRVRRLAQHRANPVQDECLALGQRRRTMVRQREVLLECDTVPVVYAHTAVPLTATVHDWPFFGGLGERALGSMLFVDPRVRRDAFTYARLQPSHPLVQRAAHAANIAPVATFARRCLYRRHRGVMLVTELFLPAVHTLPVTPPTNRIAFR